MKVVLNPKHFHLRANPKDGSIWLTHEKYLHGVHTVKDVTNDVLLALCADFSANEANAVRTEREVRFSDGWTCKVTVEMVQEQDNAEV